MVLVAGAVAGVNFSMVNGTEMQHMPDIAETLMAYDVLQSEVAAMVIHYSNILLFYSLGLIVFLTFVIAFLLWQLIKK